MGLASLAMLQGAGFLLQQPTSITDVLLPYTTLSYYSHSPCDRGFAISLVLEAGDAKSATSVPFLKPQLRVRYSLPIGQRAQIPEPAALPRHKELATTHTSQPYSP